MNKIFVILPLFLAISFLVLPFGIFYDSQIMRIVSTSMLPTLQPNDLIIVKDIEIIDVEVGQIIVFDLDFENLDSISHRVIAIGNDSDGKLGIDTKGDNIDSPDSWTVYEENLVGVVVDVIPYMGIFMIEPIRYILIAVIILTSISLLREHYKQEKTKNV